VDDAFMNVFIIKIIEEMGETEIDAVNALKLADNDIVEAVKVLELIKHKDIDYYLEIATKEV
jgi:hypothetical protein